MTKKLIHTPIADSRGTIVERLERNEAQYDELIQKLPQWITTGVLSATQKMYDQLSEGLYNQLANEHGRVFDVQEKAFLALATSLHRRLSVLEAQAGIASPELETLRALVDAIAEQSADMPAEDIGPAPADSPESTPADAAENQTSILADYQPVGNQGGRFQDGAVTETQINRARGLQ